MPRAGRIARYLPDWQSHKRCGDFTFRLKTAIPPAGTDGGTSASSGMNARRLIRVEYSLTAAPVGERAGADRLLTLDGADLVAASCWSKFYADKPMKWHPTTDGRDYKSIITSSRMRGVVDIVQRI